MDFANLTLGVNRQAWAVLHMLAGRELDCNADDVNVYFTTAPWYNGRERGFVLSCWMLFEREQLNVAFFEHRNSDSICALKWVSEQRNNPPTIADSGSLAYPTDNKFDDIAFSVGYGDAGRMADWVRKQFEDYIKSHPCDESKSVRK